MKFISTLFLCLFFLTSGNSQIINEFHYDNAGGDVGEFVEIAIPDPQPGDLSMYQITHYNGNSSGGVISSTTLDAISVTCSAGICYYVWTPSSLQNGPDGIALSGPSGLIEFISYEGVVTAVGGPVPGAVSTNVGVSEGSSTPIGTSIARNASGVWESGIIETPGAINTNALPIDLSKFSVRLEGKSSVILHWTTEMEIDNDYFEIEYSADGRHFSTIAEVPGAGNSFQEIDYNYTHESPNTGTNYYRLKQVDFSRSFSISDVKSINISGSSDLQVWPTLVEDRATVNFGDELVDGKLSVTNAQGQTVLIQEVNGHQGNLELDLSTLVNGTYIVLFESNGAVSTRRILVQK